MDEALTKEVASMSRYTPFGVDMGALEGCMIE